MSLIISSLVQNNAAMDRTFCPTRVTMETWERRNAPWYATASHFTDEDASTPWLLLMETAPSCSIDAPVMRSRVPISHFPRSLVCEVNFGAFEILTMSHDLDVVHPFFLASKSRTPSSWSYAVSSAISICVWD